MVASPIQASPRRPERVPILPRSVPAARHTSSTPESGSVHDERNKIEREMAHMVETVTDNKADRSKETLSEAAHTTTLAPRSRNSSLLPSATAILTPPVVWEPATHGPTTGVHGEMYKWAAPKNLDIELLFGDFELTIPERVTFLPLHRSWPAFMIRCLEGLWEVSDIAKLIVYSRDLYKDDPAPVKAEHMTQLRGNVRRSLRLAKFIVEAEDTEHLIDGTLNDGKIGFTTRNWQYTGDADRKKYPQRFEHYELLRLAHKVRRLPQGKGQGILTIAILNAQAKGHSEVLVSDLASYVAKEGLTAPTFTSAYIAKEKLDSQAFPAVEPFAMSPGPFGKASGRALFDLDTLDEFREDYENMP